MKIKAKEPKQPQKTGGKRGMLRAAARARRKAKYGAQFLSTEKNQKRVMRRHLRANPGDVNALSIYERKFGPPNIELNARGRKLEYLAHYGHRNWRFHRGAASPPVQPG